MNVRARVSDIVLKMEDFRLSAVRSYPYKYKIDVEHITVKKFRLSGHDCGTRSADRENWGLADSSLVLSCDVIL